MEVIETTDLDGYTYRVTIDVKKDRKDFIVKVGISVTNMDHLYGGRFNVITVNIPHGKHICQSVVEIFREYGYTTKLTDSMRNRLRRYRDERKIYISSMKQ